MSGYAEWVESLYPKSIPAHGIRKGHTIDGKLVTARGEWQSAMDGYFVSVTLDGAEHVSYPTGATIVVGVDVAAYLRAEGITL